MAGTLPGMRNNSRFVSPFTWRSKYIRFLEVSRLYVKTNAPINAINKINPAVRKYAAKGSYNARPNKVNRSTSKVKATHGSGKNTPAGKCGENKVNGKSPVGKNETIALNRDRSEIPGATKLC